MAFMTSRNNAAKARYRRSLRRPFPRIITHLRYVYLYYVLMTLAGPMLGTVVAAAVDDDRRYYGYNPTDFAASFETLRRDLVATEERYDPFSSGDACHSNGTSSTAPRDLVVAAVQLATAAGSTPRNMLARAEAAVERAVRDHHATVVLLPELMLGPYFCQSQEAVLFAMAQDLTDSPFVRRFQRLAAKLQVVLPLSLFEVKNNAYYNSVIMIDSDGSLVDNGSNGNGPVYRKSHIPDGTGYQEKFYFSPGDTGFRVFRTREGFRVGVGICWDQWFPEAARAMALLGADVLLYPTAIGSEPQDPTLDSADHWQRVMQGHAAANMIPVVASNRIGIERLLDDDGHERQRIRFYGRSFITDETGAVLHEADSDVETDVIVTTVDANKNRATRAAWGLFRDRRPELYAVLGTKDGVSK